MPAFSPVVPILGAVFNAQTTASFLSFTPALPGYQYRVVNAGNVVVFLAVSAVSSAEALSLVAGVTTSIALLPGTVETFGFNGKPLFIATKTASGTATVYITPGVGE